MQKSSAPTVGSSRSLDFRTRTHTDLGRSKPWMDRLNPSEPRNEPGIGHRSIFGRSRAIHFIAHSVAVVSAGGLRLQRPSQQAWRCTRRDPAA